MRRVVLCLTVGLALVFSASLGAGAAGAQSGGGDNVRVSKKNLRVSKKTVEKFVRRQARIVAERQMALFPNADVTVDNANDFIIGCIHSYRSTPRRPLWKCYFDFVLTETNRSNPDQWTIRSCSSAVGDVSVRRARTSRRLSIIEGWRMSCTLSEFAIKWWNDRGPDYQSDRSDPISVPTSTRKPPQQKPRDDLLPAPGGAPGGVPPGPLWTGAQIQSANSTARIASRGALRGCHNRWLNNVFPGYWVYYCYWDPTPLPGAGLGIFNTVTYFEGYYWVGNDANGQAVSRLFTQGTF